jgi:lipoic acid synthetase
VGLGETGDELTELFDDLAGIGLDILTIGQYLQPSKEHVRVARYYDPDEFVSLERLAVERGIKVVKAGPYVRSSFLAEESFKMAEESFKLKDGGFCKSLRHSI